MVGQEKVKAVMMEIARKPPNRTSGYRMIEQLRNLSEAISVYAHGKFEMNRVSSGVTRSTDC